MQSEKIIKVILYHDGCTYILLNKDAALVCTAQSLSALMADPIKFYAEEYKKGYAPKKGTFPVITNVFNASGLTLLYVTKDNRIVCEFPELYSALFLKLANKEITKPIMMDDYIDRKQLSNTKSYLIKFYLENISSTNSSKVNLSYPVKLTAEQNYQIMQEIMQTNLYLNTSEINSKINFNSKDKNEITVSNASEINKEPEKENRSVSEEHIKELALEDETERYKLTPNHVRLSEYAKLYDKKVGTVRGWIKENKFKSAVKSSTGLWYVDKNEMPADGRAGRTILPNEKGHKHTRWKKDMSYEEVQIYIDERNLFSKVTRPYIRTVEEARWYFNHSYHEIFFSGSASDGTLYQETLFDENKSTMVGLCIDIKPEYYSVKHGKTNRQLIMAGNSPVVPNDEDRIYHLHHIGQREDSPFAILPSDIHLGSETNAIFHLSKSTDKDLHGSEFDEQRKRFWRLYLDAYDKAKGKFNKIPFYNHKK